MKITYDFTARRFEPAEGERPVSPTPAVSRPEPLTVEEEADLRAWVTEVEPKGSPIEMARLLTTLDTVRAALAECRQHHADTLAGLDPHTGPTSAPGLDSEEASLALSALNEAIRSAAHLRHNTVTISMPLAHFLAARLAEANHRSP